MAACTAGVLGVSACSCAWERVLPSDAARAARWKKRPSRMRCKNADTEAEEEESPAFGVRGSTRTVYRRQVEERVRERGQQTTSTENHVSALLTPSLPVCLPLLPACPVRTLSCCSSSSTFFLSLRIIPDAGPRFSSALG